MISRKKFARLRPLALKASWSVAEQAVSPLLLIVLTPYLLGQLGIEQYGLWMLVMALVGMGQLASLGAGTAVIKHVSADLEKGEYADAVATVRAAVAIVLAGGGIVTLVAAVAAPLIAQTLFSKMGSVASVSPVIALGFLLMLVQELDNVFASALRGAQRFDLSARVEFLTRVVWCLGVVVLAWLYQSLTAILGGIFVLSVIKAGFKAYQVNRLFMVKTCHVPCFERSFIKRVAIFGKWQWVQSFGGMLFSVADRILIGSIFGATDLARYSICLQLAQFTHAIPAVAAQVVFPWLSAKIAKGQQTEHLSLYKSAIYAGSVCSLLPAAVFLVSPQLLNAWLGTQFYVGNIELELLLVFAYGILAFNVPAHYFLMGLGRIRFLSLVNLAAGLLSVLLSLILAPLGLIWFSAAKILFGLLILVNFVELKRASKCQASLNG